MAQDDLAIDPALLPPGLQKFLPLALLEIDNGFSSRYMRACSEIICFDLPSNQCVKGASIAPIKMFGQLLERLASCLGHKQMIEADAIDLVGQTEIDTTRVHLIHDTTLVLFDNSKSLAQTFDSLPEIVKAAIRVGVDQIKVLLSAEEGVHSKGQLSEIRKNITAISPILKFDSVDSTDQYNMVADHVSARAIIAQARLGRIRTAA